MRVPWNAADHDEFCRLYPITPTRVIAEKLSRTECAIYQRAETFGLRKSAEFLRSSAACRFNKNSTSAETQFKPGHKTWNAGLKGWTAGGRSAETQFKSGQRGNKWLPVGSERVSKDGIRERKISDDWSGAKNWRAMHALLWQEINGLIPRDHIVVFSDGNRENLRIENLELITRAENMRRNSVHNLPKELATLCQLKGAVQRQLNKRANV